MTVWIASVGLSSSDESQRFWGLPTDQVSTRLMLRAPTEEVFKRNLETSLSQRGILSCEIEDVAEVNDLCSPELVAAARETDETVPRLFGRISDRSRNYATRIDEIEVTALEPDDDLWALVDGVQWPEVAETLSATGADCVSLYTSTSHDTIASSPWLIHLAGRADLLTLIKERPPEIHTGIFLRSTKTMKDLRQHLRRYTMAYLPKTEADAPPVYFRFYDPRVLLDMTTALDDEAMAQFMAPFTEILTPLSPEIVLPDHAQIALPVTPFDSPSHHKGRTASIKMVAPSSSQSRSVFRISQTEYARFEKLQRKKAERKMARQLSLEFPGKDWAQYRVAAKSAPIAARQFNLTTIKQVSALARAILICGPEFWLHNPKAAAILNRNDMRPWQKKNALLEWLVSVKQEMEAT